MSVSRPVPTDAVLAAALASTSVAVFVAGRVEDGMPVLWVNDAFVAQTGHPRSELVGVGSDRLALLLSDPREAQEVRERLLADVPVDTTVRTVRHDGGVVWSTLTMSAVRDAAGVSTHWVGVLVDVSEHVERSATQLASLEAERRERAALDLVAQTADLLTDLEYPYALRDIAELLRDVVPWAGFFLNDDGLVHSDGVDVSTPPTGRGRRHARWVATPPPHPAATDPLGDATDAGTSSGPSRVDLPDAVQDLLDGHLDGPVTLDLTAVRTPYSASAWLAQDLPGRVEAVTGQTPRSVVVHAVPGRRRVLGLLVTWPGHGVQESEQAATVAELVARRAGMAVDNARLYAREHRLAETLQRAMLPEQADVVGLDVWTYYAPNAEHAQVGGDWYDVLQIDRDVVGVVIGDVVGHDVEAAATMGQLRSVVRSYAYELTDPGPVLERVDQLVLGMRVPRSASLVYAALTRDEEGGGWSARYARAGHLPPLLVRDGTVTQLADAGGALVGFGTRERTAADHALAPGDVLLFYTDGLIERRDRSLRAGLDALVDLSGAITARDAAGVGEELLSRLADAPEDDVALVVVRVPDPVGDAVGTALSPRSRRWLLPSEPASIGRARHAVLRTCQAWGLPDSPNAELVVSELVANGVLHGWGHVALRLFDTGDGLRVEVEDSNPAPPVATDGHPNRVGGFGMQIVERLADWGWRPSGPGKLVWARLRPTPPGGPSAPAPAAAGAPAGTPDDAGDA